MKTETTESKSFVWKVLGLAGIGVLAIALILGIRGFFATSPSSADSATTNQNHSDMIQNSPQLSSIPPKAKTDVPAALIDAGEFGENIYDAAKIDDWKTAESRFKDLEAAVKKLDTQQIAALNTSLAKLGESLVGKDKNATLELSNQLTFEAADLASKYDPKVPVEVTKLDYYGRELEIWAGEKDEARLRATVLEIRKTWDAVKSKVEAHNGKKQAAVFEDLVMKTEAAKSISDYARLATPILDEVDNLENVFG